MDIAKLLGTAGSVLSEAGAAVSAAEGSPVKAVGGLFAKTLAKATGEADGTAQATATSTETTVDAPVVTATPVTAGTSTAGTEESALGSIAALDGTEDLDTASAKALSLALATAIVTWASQSLGSRGDDSTVTLEGRHVDSLVDDLPAALRQAIEETLAALDKRGGEIPAEIMASLNAILGAVTVSTPEVTSGPFSELEVTRLGEEMADAVMKALSGRFDGGAGILDTALQLSGADTSSFASATSASEKVMALIDQCQACLESALASDTTSSTDGLAELKEAIDTLLTQLRGTVVRVSALAAEPETVQPTVTPPVTTAEAGDDTPTVAESVRTTATPVGTSETARPAIATGQLASAPASAFGRGVKAQSEATSSSALRAVIDETVKPAEEVPVRVVASARTDAASLTEALTTAVGRASAARAAFASSVQGATEGQVVVSPLLAAASTESSTPEAVSARNVLREVLASESESATEGEVTVRRGQTSRTVSLDALERLFMPQEREERTASVTRNAAVQAAGASSVADAAVASLAATSTTAVPLDTQAVLATVESGTARANVMTQVENSLQDVASKGRQEVVIELRPPHLGDVRVTLTATEQAVTAHFLAQSHTVKAILESNMYLLKDMLNNAGVNTDDIQVSVGLGGDQSGGWRQNGDQAAMYYRSFDPRHGPVVEDASVRPVGTDVGQTYSTAAVVDLLA